LKHWLLKTEPSTFGIEDLQEATRRTTSWEGVRNFQARNFIRDQIKKGDSGDNGKVSGNLSRQENGRQALDGRSRFSPLRLHPSVFSRPLAESRSCD